MQKKHNVVMIPAQAILSETAGQKVYLYKSGRVRPVMVETGNRTNNRVEITNGIALGDSVIITGIMQITPRTMVVPAAIY